LVAFVCILQPFNNMTNIFYTALDYVIANRTENLTWLLLIAGAVFRLSLGRNPLNKPEVTEKQDNTSDPGTSTGGRRPNVAKNSASDDSATIINGRPIPATEKSYIAIFQRFQAAFNYFPPGTRYFPAPLCCPNLELTVVMKKSKKGEKHGSHWS